MLLLFLAVLPVIAFCAYVYCPDGYEREPVYLLALSLFYGGLMICAIIPCEVLLINMLNEKSGVFYALYMSFAAIAPVEEGFKFTVLYLLIRCNSNLSEPYDGIIYAVFISLGFALGENIFYVFNPELGGYTTAVMRAVFSVPGHGIFGIFMGSYFSAASFGNGRYYMLSAFAVPYILHGVYDFILFCDMPFYFVPFGIFMLYLYVRSERLIDRLAPRPYIVR